MAHNTSTLTIKRPTPTTALYTVSTRPTPQTLTGHIRQNLILTLRILTACTVVFALANEYSELLNVAIWPSLLPLTAFENTLYPLARAASNASPALSRLLQHPRLLRLATYATISALVLRKGYSEESLLVVRGLGVQTSTAAGSILGSGSTRFIPTAAIQDFFIHEAFRGFEVRFYLGIVVEGEDKVVVVFPNLLPRREILETVWRGARTCLYEPKS